MVAVQSPVMAWAMPMPIGLFSMAPSEIGMTVFRREWVVDRQSLTHPATACDSTQS